MRRAEIYSINYAFNPVIPYSAKVLWVQLRTEPPRSLRIGSLASVHSCDDNFVAPNQEFRVVDIVGTRVCLQSYTGDRYANASDIIPFVPAAPLPGWHPLHHGQEWGYATRNLADFPYACRNWTYGNGQSLAYLLWN